MNKAAHRIYLLSLIILFIFLCASSKLVINIFRNYSNHTNNVLSVKKVEIISHRAKCFIGETENSMDGIKDSISYKVDYAEIDVQETKDGVVVLMHDKTLKRLTGLNKKINQLDYKEIKELNINRLNFPECTIEEIPTLEQVVKYSSGHFHSLS
ncbi:glycerophosphodiester phosphodiesterase family protein [Clostridium sp. Mt-5]|uniref:Glycerophosphodiester phosphodiesterase family protein n=1 Tax=Clostridium moutaii TaxID=3240932 RepID=A0ABV4BSQ0_9CLOT